MNMPSSAESSTIQSCAANTPIGSTHDFALIPNIHYYQYLATDMMIMRSLKVSLPKGGDGGGVICKVKYNVVPLR